GTSLGTSPTWHDLAFALPLAMLAYTGLETVANLAEEARRPGVDLPRALFGAIATAVTLYVAVALVAVAAFPGPNTALGGQWLRAPLVGLAIRIGSELPSGFADLLRFFVGPSGGLVPHAGARYAGPAWLVVGLVVYVAVRRAHGEGLTERVVAPDEQRLEPLAPFRRILVPIKLGIIGEEMLATAIKLAAEHEGTVEA